MADSLILMVMALVVFGPRRLPQIGRQVGKLMYEFRKASNDFKFQMEEELRSAEEADRRKKEEEDRQRQLAAAPSPAQLESGAEPEFHETGPELSELPAVAEPYPLSTYSEAAEAHYKSQTEAQPKAAPESQHEAPTEASPKETYPRILPPASGQPIAAKRPGTGALETSAIDPASPLGEEAEAKAATEAEIQAHTEPAPHNG